jgi:hypothetical protein
MTADKPRIPRTLPFITELEVRYATAVPALRVHQQG